MQIAESERSGTVLSGILLVAGTSIGAGMLAMPVVTGSFGLMPSLFLNFICWAFMTATGLLTLEVVLWMSEGAHVLSMTKRFLGRPGEVLSGLAFLFLYYSLMVSYFAGGAPLLGKGLEAVGLHAPLELQYILFASLFAVIVYLGAIAVDRLNRLLVLGMLISYVLLLLVGSQAVQETLFQHARWSGWWWAAPTLFGAYGFHNIIPTIANYLNRDGRQLRIAIVAGSAITFVVYALWQWVVLGSVSAEALQDAAARGVSVAEALQTVTHSSWIPVLGSFFALFALVTSLLGVSFSMVDFLGDGLGIERHGRSRIGLCALVFLPPLLFALFNPGVFIEAMGFAGGFGEAFLNGMVPVAMVWIGRYSLGLSSEYGLPGGKFLLGFLFCVTLSVIGMEAWHVFLA